MTDRPRFFDDLAGVAGGAMSALVGVRDELESLVRARVSEAVARFDIAGREEVAAAHQMAANARAGQELAEARLDAVEARLAVLEAAHLAQIRPVGPGRDVGDGSEMTA